MPAGADQGAPGPGPAPSGARRRGLPDADRVGRQTYDAATFAPGYRPPAGLVTLVGGVSELYQSDMDLGRHVVEALDVVGPGTYVEDLSYGAIPFVHRLQELDPDVLVLVGAIERDRAPGTVHRHVVTEVDRTPEQLQQSVGDAYVGYVDLDLATDVAHAMEVLPPRTVVVEVEPAVTGSGTELSEVAEAAVVDAVRAVEREVATAPVFDLLAMLREAVPALGDSPLSARIERFVTAFDAVDAGATLGPDAPWGPLYAARDEVRRAISTTMPGQGMGHAEWGMLWSLDEALDRLRPLVVPPDDV